MKKINSKFTRFRLAEDEKEFFKDIAQFFLKIAGISLLLGVLLIAPKMGLLLKMFVNEYPEYRKEHKKIKKVLYKIYKNRLIEFREKGDKQILEVTDKGKRQFVEFNIDTIEIKKQKFDGKLRVVIFDIPEKKKIAREVLRDKLREIGFVKVQKSVWACPYECQNEIDFISSIYGVEKYVNYLVVEKADFSDSLKCYFKV